LNDPYEESYARGTIYLSQDHQADGTKVWGSIEGGSYADLTINALGDLRDGCDSTGDVFNPYVSANGTGYDKEHHDAPGELGAVGDGNIKVWANVDLSGVHSIIGRSMVVTMPEQVSHYG